MWTVDSQINQAEQILGHIFSDKMLCAEAIQMAAPLVTLSIGEQFRRVDRNTRLAVLGGVVLANALCTQWYQARNRSGFAQPSAAWNDIRNDVLSNVSLGRRGEELGIDNCIVMADGNIGFASPKMIATTFEALVGAVYQDGGEEAVLRVVEHVGLDQHSALTAPIPYMDDSGIRLQAVR